MALVRTKDIQRYGWNEGWASYPAVSGESIRSANVARADLDGGDIQFPAIVFQATLDEIGAGADITEAAIKLLIDEYSKGALDITSTAKEKEMILLEKRARELVSQLVVR